MIITHLCGGLGNQMFQYAAGLRLARRHQSQLKLDVTEYRNGAEIRPEQFAEFRRPLKLFELNVSAAPATDAEIARLKDPHATTSWRDRAVRQVRRHLSPQFRWPVSHIKEQQYRFQPATLDLADNTYLQGYWQSWRYFADINETILDEFRPKDPAVTRHAGDYVDRLREVGGPVVALHVRRGDMAYAHEINRPDLIHTGPVGIDYLNAAMQRFGAGFQYLIFSDTPKDIEWCRQNINPAWLPPGHRHFSEGHTDIQDMAIMSACDHNIIANSTFSWWAAWLNHNAARRVIAPNRWSDPGAKLAMVADDLIPPSWEII